MSKRKLLWQLFPSYIAIMMFSVIAVALLAANSLKKFYLNQEVKWLEHTARAVETFVLDKLTPDKYSEVDALCKRIGEKISVRITVIIPTGVVIADSDENPARMANHADRPEIIEALAGKVGVSKRHSPTLKKDMIYVAIPVKNGEQIISIVRASIPAVEFSQALRSLYFKIVAECAIIVFIVALVSLAIARKISRPIEEVKLAADRFAKGNLDYRVFVEGPSEVADLAETMNKMASQLAERIQTETRQRNELEAVLSSMVEAVIAVDSDMRIIRLNKAACELLGVDFEQAYNKSTYEVVRNPDLNKVVERALSASQPIESEVVMHGFEDRFLQAHGTILLGTEGEKIGALVVLNDITRLKRLENMRREFVANVSHELKTPITSIKGFVETLKEGAFEDKENAKKFLEIISKHSDRLNAIIEDLLTLSKIEQDEESGQIFVEEGKVKDILESAISTLALKADEKRITLELECPAELVGKFNHQLLEQAVLNLIDNAIKFSPPKSKVRVEAYKAGKEIVIKVQDWGAGIASEHLPRIFERFYRVDKSRSRQLGGTGLGLAITKHIVQAHKGRVDVQSKLGEGSTFYIYLPA